MAKEYILVQIAVMQPCKEITALENQVALVQCGSKKVMSLGQSKKKSNINSLQTQPQWDTQNICSYFFSIYTSNLLNIRFVPKKKQNKIEFIYQAVFNLLYY